MSRVVVFLSDFGLDDEFVGVCHAVMSRVAPATRVIDLTHGIPPGDVRRGALSLAAAVPHAPEGAVFLAVVDPGVGTDRRGVAVGAGGSFLVGPDNGVLALAWEALGGPDRAHAIEPARVSGSPPSATFHGRDVFAPAAALLSQGAELQDLGPAVDVATLGGLELPRPEVAPGRLRAEVIGVDRFGNVQLGARPQDVPWGDPGSPVEVRASGNVHRVRVVRTFGDLGTGQLGLLVDSAGWLAVVLRGDSVAAVLRLRPGDDVLLSFPAWDSAS